MMKSFDLCLFISEKWTFLRKFNVKNVFCTLFLLEV